MVRWVMRRKRVMSLEELVGQAQTAGVRLVILLGGDWQ